MDSKESAYYSQLLRVTSQALASWMPARAIFASQRRLFPNHGISLP